MGHALSHVGNGTDDCRPASLKGVNTLLDLGGGPGTYAMAFLAKHPRLRATVCDRPAALEVAKEIAATHKAGVRLSYMPWIC